MADQTTEDVATGVVVTTGDDRDTTGAPTLGKRIVALESQFALAAPRGYEAQQLVRDAMVSISKTPKLAECEPTSVLGSLMTMAQLGLRVGVLGHGWVLPFWDSRAKWQDDQGRTRTGQYKAQLVVGYQGLVELAYRSDRVAALSARSVHEGDVFELEYGADEHLVHRPARTNRGDVTGYYAACRIVNGGSTFWYFSREEAETYRDRYAMAKTRDGKIVGPWRDDFDAMARKTTIRQLSKYIPKGTSLATALAVDDSIRVDLNPLADPLHVSEHPSLPDVPETTMVDPDASGVDLA